jgi:electron-transferring-flavoprotein dehydrogenase
VIEKAKTCGGHNLSGAVMRPGPLGELFPDLSREQWRQEGFAFGEVKKEAIYALPNGKSKIRIPPPPPQRNHGNEVISVSALCRYMQAQAEEAGAYLLTETAATQLIVDDGAVLGVRSGDKGRGKEGEELSNFEPGTDIAAKATVLAEGCWGHLTDAAVREFELDEGREPQVWELGVKEVWKVKEPLDRVIHTIAGWPLKISAKYHQIGGTWIYPMVDEKTGETWSRSAWCSTSTTPTRPAPPTTSCSSSRPTDGAQDPRRRRAGQRRHGQPAALKGVHYAIKAGMLAAEQIYAALKDGSNDFSGYEAAVEDSIIKKDLYEQRNTRRPFQKGLLKGGPAVTSMVFTKGRFPGGRWKLHRNDAQPMFIGDSKDEYPSPTASSPSTSFPASSSAATRPVTTPPTTSACKSASPARSPRPGNGCAPRASTRSPTTPPRAATST